MNEYFYIMTIQWSVDGNPNYGTATGIWEKPYGTTEQEIYGEIFANSCTLFRAPADACGVMFYRATRNEP